MIEDFLNKVVCGDCLEVLKQLPDESVNLIPTDPPYNIGKDFENDNLSKEDYLAWCEKWISECVRVLKIGGAIYITLGFQTVAEVKVIFNKFDSLRLKNWIVWYRQDGWKGDNGFAHSHEHILYFIKDSVPIFDLKEFGAHVKERRLAKGYATISALMESMGIYTKVQRSDGTEDYFSGCGWFESGKKRPTLQELVLLNDLVGLDKKYAVFLNEINRERLKIRDYLNETRIKKGLSLADINKHFGWAITGGGCASSYMGDKELNMVPCPKHYLLLKELLGMDNRFDEIIKKFGVKFNKTDVCDDVWLTPKSERNRLGHPTQKPVGLFRRILKASSSEGDVVLDPFAGSGSVLVACKQLNRNFIGIEISPEYIKIIESRLKQKTLNPSNKGIFEF